MTLDSNTIGKTVKEIKKFFEAADVAKQDIMKLCLVFENALIQYQEKFGADHEFTVRMKKWFSAPKVIIRVKGEPFNPLQNYDPIFNMEVMQNLLSYETARTTYSYSGGCNEISSFSTKERKPVKIPGGSMTLSILAAVICALLVQFLPPAAQSFLIEDCTPLLTKTFMGVIVAVTGPFIFISIVSGILAMDGVDTLNIIGLKIVRRFIRISLLIAIITAIVCEIFYSVIVFDSKTTFEVSQIVELFLGIVPTNLFTPFTEGKVLQIVIIAFFTGVCILMIESVVPDVKNIAIQLNKVIAQMFKIVSKVIVTTIFLSVFHTLSTVSLENIATVWSIIAVNYITFAIISGLGLLRLFIKYKVNIKEFLGQISEIILISLTTASNTAAMQKNFDVAVKNLKVNENLCSIWFPLSHSIFSPGATIGLVVAVFYSASFTGGTISIVELLMTIYLALQLSMATPPVPGGIMPIYVMLLQQINLPNDALGSLMLATVFVLNVSAASSTIIRDSELLDFAHKMNYLERENKNV